MKITYIHLKNVAGLAVGSNKEELIIDFSKSINTIVALVAGNGSGKTTLLSSLTPFSGVTSVDDRSTLSYIMKGKDGYKEIHYQDNDDEYIIKHYYKANKDSHSVKSYIMKNGEELNENGNVSSFVSLVEIHLGLTTEMMRLIRLGTNVNSFITLQPARRKEYIGKLISEIDLYLKIYKKINEDIRVVKVLMSTNTSNMNNCHISDISEEENNLSSIESAIKAKEKERDKLIARIGKIQALMNDNNIDDIRRKKNEAESSIIDFEKTSNRIDDMGLSSVSVESLIKQLGNLNNARVDTQARINSYRISIDGALRNIERLESSIKKVTSNIDLNSLMSTIDSLKRSINDTSGIVKSFKPIGATAEEIQVLISKLSSYNQIAQMIYTFGNKPVNVYLKLKANRSSVDDFLKKHRQNNASMLNDSEIKHLMDQVFQNDSIIMPACDTEYMECPYYRLSSVISDIHNKMEEDSFDSETLRYIQIISNNIDMILNELDRYQNMRIPDKLIMTMKEKDILDHMSSRLPFFELSGFQEYLSIQKEYEIYCENRERLKQLQEQLSVYQNSGVNVQLKEIEEQRKSIEFYRSNIETLTKELNKIKDQIEDLEMKIGLLTKYNDGKKYQSILKSQLDSALKILQPLESAAQEKMELNFHLQHLASEINSSREQYKLLENKINEYKRLREEKIKLDQSYRELSIIQESVSTKKGIPVIYMKNYLGNIRKLANRLLKMIYDDDLKLADFNITQDAFEVPYSKNGMKIQDVRYASQSEVALITMALSFALANQASGKYNILLLDEIDAGLDEQNRSAFMSMLNMQMQALKAEQVFIISQNLTQMANVPMDCIVLNKDIAIKSRMRNVIYQ